MGEVFEKFMVLKMSGNWPNRELRDLAEIRVSNVDKKVHASEKPVKLCNYMDVYSNEYVTSSLPFMEASATAAEIERFGLNKGDVIITKDSETPDDIGIPAVVMERIGNLVCGYHLALIRPIMEELDSVYLAKQLSTERVARYFALHASGSTRYGLPISSIEKVEIPTPPKPEQTKIAEILSMVDRAIEQTEALIAKQQRIKTGLMQDLLTRGIDEHGNLRSEKTHQFKDSSLGRIPVEWEVAALSSAVKLIKRGPSLSTNNENRGIIYLTSDNISETGQLIWQIVKYLDARPESLNSIIEIGDVILNCVNSEAQIGKTGFVNELIGVTTTGFNNFGLSFKENVVVPKFVFYQLSYANFQRELRKKIKPAINQSSFSSTDIADLPVIIPRLEEQQLVADKIDSISKNVQSLSKTLSKVTKLKTALMQDLLTGKKRVTSLLADTMVTN